MRGKIVPVAPDAPQKVFDSFNRALKQNSQNDSILLGGFAYVTHGGTKDFLSQINDGASWKALTKNFIIGIHHGITEPSAFEMLCDLTKSKVKMFIPGGKLTAQALFTPPLFHPKVLALTQSRNGNLNFLHTGSANLTSSAIGRDPKNYELSISLQKRDVLAGSAQAFTNWWSRVWSDSKAVDPALIKKYASVRLSVLDQNPILRHAAGLPSDIGNATNFFIEVGAASGPPDQRHQIEFPEALVAFFGPPVRKRRDLKLANGKVVWSGRPLSYKVTTYGVEIWRLGMPTQNSGGEPISYRAINFSRTKAGDQFDFEVADVNSKSYIAWKNAANVYGHLGATQGSSARIYGFY